MDEQKNGFVDNYRKFFSRCAIINKYRKPVSFEMSDVQEEIFQHLLSGMNERGKLEGFHANFLTDRQTGISTLLYLLSIYQAVYWSSKIEIFTIDSGRKYYANGIINEILKHSRIQNEQVENGLFRLGHDGAIEVSSIPSNIGLAHKVFRSRHIDLVIFECADEMNGFVMHDIIQSARNVNISVIMESKLRPSLCNPILLTGDKSYG